MKREFGNGGLSFWKKPIRKNPRRPYAELKDEETIREWWVQFPDAPPARRNSGLNNKGKKDGR